MRLRYIDGIAVAQWRNIKLHFSFQITLKILFKKFDELAILHDSTFSVNRLVRIFEGSGNSGRWQTCLKNSSRSSPVNLVWIFQGLTQFEISAQCNKSSMILIFSILKYIFIPSCRSFYMTHIIWLVSEHIFSYNTLYLRSRIFCRFIN